MARSLFATIAFLLSCAALAAPSPVPSVTGWGSPIDPDRDCKIRNDKGALIIEMPFAEHVYDPLRKCVNAPRLLRELEGDFDLQVRVRIDCLPSQWTIRDQPSYVAAGFLVIFPDTFFHKCFRMEYRVATQGDGADGCIAHMSWSNGGQGSTIFDKGWPYWPCKTKPDHVYIRLNRWDESLGFYISSDRKSWVSIGGHNLVGLSSKLKVGFVACSTSSEASRVQFDQLKFSREKRRVPWEFGSDWSNPVDPDKDCKIQRNKDALTIEMPGSDHDYDPVRKRLNAPRLLSELEGEFDVQVRVRIDYSPSPKSTVKDQPSFVSAGFLLIFPEKDGFICTRLEYAASQLGSRPYVHPVAPRLAEPRRSFPAPQGTEADGYAVLKSWVGYMQRKGKQIEWDNGRPSQYRNSMWGRGWQNWPLPLKADCAYLRLEQRVNGWAGFYISPDGQKWTRLDYVPGVPAGGKVALAAYSTSTEPSKVVFDQLKLARSKKNER